MVRISSGFIFLCPGYNFSFAQIFANVKFQLYTSVHSYEEPSLYVFCKTTPVEYTTHRNLFFFIERDPIHSTSCSMLFTSSQLKIEKRIYFPQESAPCPPASGFRDLGYSSVMTRKQSCSSGAHGKFGLWNQIRGLSEMLFLGYILHF